jgi:hypothetical protein
MPPRKNTGDQSEPRKSTRVAAAAAKQHKLQSERRELDDIMKEGKPRTAKSKTKKTTSNDEVKVSEETKPRRGRKPTLKEPASKDKNPKKRKSKNSDTKDDEDGEDVEKPAKKTKKTLSEELDDIEGKFVVSSNSLTTHQADEFVALGNYESADLDVPALFGMVVGLEKRRSFHSLRKLVKRTGKKGINAPIFNAFDKTKEDTKHIDPEELFDYDEWERQK